MLRDLAAALTAGIWLRIRDPDAFRELQETARQVNLELARHRAAHHTRHEGDTASIAEWGRGG